MSGVNGQQRERPASFDLETDEWGRLIYSEDGGLRVEGVEPVRAFPFTDPDRWVSLVDAGGREVRLIEDLSELPSSLRDSIEAELARREFLPVIERIERIEEAAPYTVWSVCTDRGPARFSVEGEDQIRRLGSTRLVITDREGRRFLVADVNQLDRASRRRLELFL